MLIRLIAAAVILPSFAFAKTDQEYWNSVDPAPLDQVMTRMDRSSLACGHSTTNFLGCIKAVNAIGLHLTPVLEITSLGSLSERVHEDGYRIVERVGNLALVEIRYDNRSHITSMKSLLFEASLRKRRLIRDIEKMTIDEGSVGLLARIATQMLDKVTSVPKQQAAVEAISAMMQIRDAHALLEPSEAFADASSGVTKKVGIGVEVQSVLGQTVIARVFKGGPAYQQGIQAGDVILTVDDVSIFNMPLAKVTEKIRGEANQQGKNEVKLVLLRAGQKIAITVVRKAYQRLSITSEVTELNGKKYQYIQLESFYANSNNSACSDMKPMIEEANKEKMSGIILDLRNNPGGDVRAVSCLVGLFVGKKLVMSLRPIDGVDPKSEKIKVLPDLINPEPSDEAQLTELPLVVLVNARSASASEVFAGSMKNYKRAWLVGETTFGKGSMQSVYPFSVYGQGLNQRNTMGLYFLANNWTPQLTGVKPDLEVFATPEIQSESFEVLREHDLYPTALEIGEVGEQPQRPASQIAQMQSCVVKGQAKARYASDASKGPAIADYQRKVAEDTLGCITDRNFMTPTF